jgi:hypothetical protein
MQAGNNSTAAKPGSRLRELGLVLPKAPTPLGAYVEASEVGSLLFLSGMLPVVNGKLSITGRLGENLSVDQGREAVADCGDERFGGRTATSRRPGSLKEAGEAERCFGYDRAVC